MANVLVEETSLQNIANSIREKTGTTDTYKPSEMASAISGISTGGGSAPEKGIVINEWDNSGRAVDISIVGFTKIPSCYFYNVISVGNPFDSIFQNATLHLSDTLTSIGSHAFYYCGGLTQLEIPETVTQIDESAFYYCTGLTSLNLSGVKSISKNCFNHCSALRNITLSDDVTGIGEQAFISCTELALSKLPNNLKSLGYGAFAMAENVSITEIPSGVTTISGNVFRKCTGLTKLNCLGIITKIETTAFYECSNLAKIFLPNVTSVPTLGNKDAFTNTPIASGTGYIYVPDDLVDSFKITTNWSNYADQIKPISVFNLQSIEIVSKSSINTYISDSINISITYNNGDEHLFYPEQEGYTLSVSGNATLDGNILTLTDNAQVGDIITVTVTSTYDASISSTREIEVVYIDKILELDLNNGQWLDSGTTVDGNIVYKSDAGSYYINNGKSTAILTVVGYTNVKLYIRSYAEGSYDYTEAFALDTKAERSKGLFTTKGKQSATDYVECVYTLDGGEHTIEIMYSKDSSGNTSDDRGYFYIGEVS